MSSTAYTHSICSPRHRAVMPTTYTHSMCSPRYMVVISTVHHPHYMYPQHITRHPHYMCYPHHMHMVWVTLTLFPTAYDPRHKLFSTAYTHGIYTPDIPWVYAVDTTCICRGSHMPWVHMSSTDALPRSCVLALRVTYLPSTPRVTGCAGVCVCHDRCTTFIIELVHLH